MIKKEIILEKRQKTVNLLQDYGFSFADVNKMLRNKDVKVNGKATKENVMLEVGDEVVFFYSPEMLDKKADIIFENDDVYIVYKSAGIESDGEKGLEKVLKGAIAVHRLDRNTEGLMVFAKNQTAEKKLLKAFKEKTVRKFYLAEIIGMLEAKNKTFKAYLVKDSENSSVKVNQNKVKDAVEISMIVNTIKAGKESSLVEIELLTGRTHQIRAHLAFLGHAIIGDGKYGKNQDNKKFKQTRQKLACIKLKFNKVGIEGLDGKEFVKNPKWKV